MTVDEENSIYVGGLPYDCTESLLRRVFELYGAILSVKIINGRETGGKCYAFVTFTNPRSTVEAINEMDGKIIGGRAVKVNEVNSRGGGRKSIQDRGSFRHNQRDTDRNGGRGRGREKVFVRDRLRHSSRELNGERERWGEGSRDRSRDRSCDHSRDNFQGRNRGESRDMQNRERFNSRSDEREADRGYDLDATKDTQLDRVVDHDSGDDKSKDHHRTRKRSGSYDHPSGEHTSELSDYHHQEEQLDLLVKRRDELYEEKSDMEQSLEDKKQLTADLQKTSMKLEDSLTSAKKLTSMRQLQLTELYKCFQSVKDFDEKLKRSEQELQDIIDSVSAEIDQWH